MKTSTAIILVGGVAVVVFFLTRKSTPVLTRTTSTKSGSSGDSAAVAAIKGVFSLGDTALKSWLSGSTGSGGTGSTDASGVYDQQTQNDMESALTFNGLFG